MKKPTLLLLLFFAFPATRVFALDGYVDTTELLVLTRAYNDGNAYATKTLEKGKAEYSEGMVRIQDKAQAWQRQAEQLRKKPDLSMERKLTQERMVIEEQQAALESALQQSILAAQEILTAGSMGAIREIHEMTRDLAREMKVERVFTSAGLVYFDAERVQMRDLTPELKKRLSKTASSAKEGKAVQP